MDKCILQSPICMCLLTITRLHNKAAVVVKCLLHLFVWVGALIIMQVIDVIDLLTPFLQAYPHQFAGFSPFCKRFDDKSYIIKDS